MRKAIPSDVELRHAIREEHMRSSSLDSAAVISNILAAKSDKWIVNRERLQAVLDSMIAAVDPVQPAAAPVQQAPPQPAAAPSPAPTSLPIPAFANSAAPPTIPAPSPAIPGFVRGKEQPLMPSASHGAASAPPSTAPHVSHPKPAASKPLVKPDVKPDVKLDVKADVKAAAAGAHHATPAAAEKSPAKAKKAPAAKRPADAAGDHAKPDAALPAAADIDAYPTPSSDTIEAITAHFPKFAELSAPAQAFMADYYTHPPLVDYVHSLRRLQPALSLTDIANIVRTSPQSGWQTCPKKDIETAYTHTPRRGAYPTLTAAEVGTATLPDIPIIRKLPDDRVAQVVHSTPLTFIVWRIHALAQDLSPIDIASYLMSIPGGGWQCVNKALVYGILGLTPPPASTPAKATPLKQTAAAASPARLKKPHEGHALGNISEQEAQQLISEGRALKGPLLCFDFSKEPESFTAYVVSDGVRVNIMSLEDCNRAQVLDSVVVEYEPGQDVLVGKVVHVTEVARREKAVPGTLSVMANMPQNDDRIPLLFTPNAKNALRPCIVYVDTHSFNQISKNMTETHYANYETLQWGVIPGYPIGTLRRTTHDHVVETAKHASKADHVAASPKHASKADHVESKHASKADHVAAKSKADHVASPKHSVKTDHVAASKHKTDHVASSKHKTDHVANPSTPQRHTGPATPHHVTPSTPHHVTPSTPSRHVTPSKRAHTPRRTIYEPHLSPIEVEAQLKSGLLVQGTLRVNPKNPKMAFCAVPGLPSDVLLSGAKYHNRALDGDTVAIKLADASRFHTRQGKFAHAHRDKNNSLSAHVDELMDDLSLDDVIASPDHVDNSVKQPCGQVVAIIARSPHRTVVGRLLSKSGLTPANDKRAELEPIDPRYPHVWLSKDALPPRVLEGGPEQLARRLIAVTISDWGDNSQLPSGTFIDEMGDIGSVEVQTAALLLSQNVTYSGFDDAILGDLPRVPWVIPEEEMRKRRDMRDVEVFSIDPKTARDLDDALHIRELPDGTYEVGVHIADVSHFIPPSSPLDLAALSRGTTIYLVQRAIHMLPRVLCEDLCSLNAHVDRLAFSVVYVMTKEGEIIKEWFGRTVIRSRGKMAYEDVQEMIEGAKVESGREMDSEECV